MSLSKVRKIAKESEGGVRKEPKVVLPSTPNDYQVQVEIIEQETENLRKTLTPKLTSISEMSTGGSYTRSKVGAEQGYLADINELNAKRAKYGLKQLGLGDFRRD